jgi:hypothetical protein
LRDLISEQAVPQSPDPTARLPWRAPHRAFQQSSSTVQAQFEQMAWMLLKKCCPIDAKGCFTRRRNEIEKQRARDIDKRSHHEENQESRISAGGGDCQLRCGYAGPRVCFARRTTRRRSNAILRHAASRTCADCVRSRAQRAPNRRRRSSTAACSACLGITQIACK